MCPPLSLYLPGDGFHPARQLHWLDERSVARRIPHREPDPFLAGRVEWDLEVVRAERWMISEPDDLPIRLLTVPHTTSANSSGNVHSTSAEIVRRAPLPVTEYEAISTSPDVTKKLPFFRLSTIGAKLSPVTCPSGLR